MLASEPACRQAGLIFTNLTDLWNIPSAFYLYLPAGKAGPER